MSRVLVVCYSRSGCTASLVQEIVGMTGWERADIHDRHPREGIWGQVRCVMDALTHWHPGITDDPSPERYDLLVVAAPVWMRSLASPMRTYLARYRGKIKSLAFVCTYGGGGADQAARQASRLANVPLKAELAVTAFELEQADYRKRLDEFLARLRT